MFQENVDFSNILVEGDFDLRVINNDVAGAINTVIGEADFTNAVFREGCNLAGTSFGQPPIFSQSNLQYSNFKNSDLDGVNFFQADLTDVDFTSASLNSANLESARLSRAILFNADLRGAKIYGAILGDVQIDDNTQFLGQPIDSRDTSPHTLSAMFSQQCCVYDQDYEDDENIQNINKAKNVYHALEELGSTNARPQLEARSFIRRQDLRKDEFQRDKKTADSLEEKVIAGTRYYLAKLARATLLYGESPWRVIGWSLGAILTFALLYPLGGWMKEEEASEPISYSQISADFVSDPFIWLSGFSNILVDSLYYSTLTYTALGFGDFKPVDLGRLLTSIETGLGAVMLALLVFILGRRAAR
jgi:uncharacterized protein YjbI with pentapeptide repeats